MKNLKALIVISAVLLLVIYGCSKQDEKTSNRKFIIGVNQFAQHPILDAVYKGLKEKLDQDGNFEVQLKVANADVMMANQINNQFINDKVDAIVTLGTPSAQSAVKATSTIPVIFGAITDPVSAKLADLMDKPGGNKTGTTNRWPFEKQISLIKLVDPNIKTLGVIVNPGEENCNAGMVVIRKEAEKNGIKLIEVPVSNTVEIMPAAKSLVGRIDAFLISPSNVVVSGVSSIIKTAFENKVPVYGGDRVSVKNGSLATYGYNDEEIGIETADLVLKILKEKKKPGDIPVALPSKTNFYINAASTNKLSVIFPEALVKQAKETF